MIPSRYIPSIALMFTTCCLSACRDAPPQQPTPPPQAPRTQSKLQALERESQYLDQIDLAATQRPAQQWLIANQDETGAWLGTDGRPSVGTTALAIAALCESRQRVVWAPKDEIVKALQWLSGQTATPEAAEALRPMDRALALLALVMTRAQDIHCRNSYRALNCLAGSVLGSCLPDGGWARTGGGRQLDPRVTLINLLSLRIDRDLGTDASRGAAIDGLISRWERRNTQPPADEPAAEQLLWAVVSQVLLLDHEASADHYAHGRHIDLQDAPRPGMRYLLAVAASIRGSTAASDFERIHRRLVRTQDCSNNNGLHGSWPPVPGRGGRVEETAWACLTLSAYASWIRAEGCRIFHETWAFENP